MQRAGQRADAGGDAGGGVGAGGGDDRAVKVEAFMPCSAAEMKYASTALTCRGSGSPRQRFMNRSTIVCGLVDLLLRHGRQAEAAGGLGDEGQRGDRDPGQVLAGLLVGDVEQLAEPPVRGEHGDRGLHVDPDVAGVHRHRERLGRRQARAEPAVDQQRPDVAEGDLADQVLDVDAAVAQRAALLVGLGDLGLEGDDALQARLEVGHLALLASRLGAPDAGSIRPSVDLRRPSGMCSRPSCLSGNRDARPAATVLHATSSPLDCPTCSVRLGSGAGQRRRDAGRPARETTT